MPMIFPILFFVLILVVVVYEWHSTINNPCAMLPQLPKWQKPFAGS
jgi:hypothetical protein